MNTPLDSDMPNFFVLIKQALETSGEIEISSFMCKDWTVHYNLYNPENFEDPNTPPEWYSPEDVYDYYESPYTNPDKVLLFFEGNIIDLASLENLVEHAQQREEDILNALVKYTFGNGGAYAEGCHYDYAKKTIEQRHQKSYTKEAFLKHNLCLNTIRLVTGESTLYLHFDCGWDEEHGLGIWLEEDGSVKIE